MDRALVLGGGGPVGIAWDAESLAVFPTNLMHATGRAAIAQAGFAQGRRAAARVGDFLT